ncbi:hypothetical protein [Photorhabdus cinerea]|uniref:Uncharacterized protein n=1 Tax=Photorhabdus cinerea TaxID=471575 RepID=A0A7X5QG76_9GAMM|nr:hypothetical protein [Photorhabdus cinerea]NHB93761.1 hypothetical protein [Photorhabdus cinerea]
MRIKYLDEGAVSKIIVTGFITERRKHNRCIDAALVMTPVRASSVGFLLKKTTITGKTAHILRAYKIICRES